MPLSAPNAQSAHQLHAAADQAEILEAALPRAYREGGLPDLPELAGHADKIGEHHRLLLAAAVALARRPNLPAAQRAESRALSAAAERLGVATAEISRAATMAARFHEAEGTDGPRAEKVRERAGQHLNLCLSRTRLALHDAVEQLRRDALLLTFPAPAPPGRQPAATARSAAPGAHVLVSPPRPADLPAQAAGRRR